MNRASIAPTLTLPNGEVTDAGNGAYDRGEEDGRPPPARKPVPADEANESSRAQRDAGSQLTELDHVADCMRSRDHQLFECGSVPAGRLLRECRELDAEAVGKVAADQLRQAGQKPLVAHDELDGDVPAPVEASSASA